MSNLATSQLIHVVTDGVMANLERMLPDCYSIAKISMGNILVQGRRVYQFQEPSLGQITIDRKGDGYEIKCFAEDANTKAWLEDLVSGVTGS
tara:strand:- start:4336 stop:4611 length:276 start_codon:yes stop_codon:yes gene_type:complete